ncbi:MAG: MarR family transcriptional regulator [Thermoplasmata archaeon]
MAGLDEKEEELVELLTSMSLGRNVARTLVCLAGMEEATSSQIERATGLRQPEVSTAINELRERGWVSKRDIKRERKGRPVHSYRLAIPFEEIIGEVEKKERSRIAKMEEDISRLKSILKKGK